VFVDFGSEFRGEVEEGERAFSPVNLVSDPNGGGVF
jgi:hypothetical protein